MAISTKTSKIQYSQEKAKEAEDAESDPGFYDITSKSSKRNLVVAELGELWSMAAPITLMNGVVFLRAMVSVLFLGRLGPLALAGGSSLLPLFVKKRKRDLWFARCHLDALFVKFFFPNDEANYNFGFLGPNKRGFWENKTLSLASN